MTSYASAMAFRQALEQRLMNEARSGPEVPLVRLRKAVAFEFLLRRLLAHRPGYWLTKGGFALQLRLGLRARTTKDIDPRAEGYPNATTGRAYRSWWMRFSICEGSGCE